MEDAAFIREFLQNADKDVYQKIQKHLDLLKSFNGLKPLTVNSTDEQIAAGAPISYELPISIDNSNFFAQGS